MGSIIVGADPRVCPNRAGTGARPYDLNYSEFGLRQMLQHHLYSLIHSLRIIR